jgi:hypothetical protein
MDSFSDISQAAERRRILEMLERGQISAAEADEIMAALEGPSAPEGPQSSGSLRLSAEQPASVPGLVALVASLGRALATAIARLSMALGRVIGAVARLTGRAQPQ